MLMRTRRSARASSFQPADRGTLQLLMTLLTHEWFTLVIRIPIQIRRMIQTTRSTRSFMISLLHLLRMRYQRNEMNLILTWEPVSYHLLHLWSTSCRYDVIALVEYVAILCWYRRSVSGVVNKSAAIAL